MRQGNWEHKPPKPKNNKYIIGRDRESDKILVLLEKEPQFEPANYYRKGSYNYYRKGHWTYWSKYHYDNEKAIEASPFLKDIREVEAETHEEAINEYSRTKVN